MRTLKGIVIGMAVLIVLGMGLLVYGFVVKGGRGGNAPSAGPGLRPPVAGERGLAAFGAERLVLPPGCHVREMVPGADRLYLRIGPEGPPCEGIVVVDPATGKTLGTLTVAP